MVTDTPTKSFTETTLLCFKNTGCVPGFNKKQIFREQLELAQKEAAKRGITIGTGTSAFAEDITEEEAEKRTSSWFDWIDPFLLPGNAY